MTTAKSPLPLWTNLCYVGDVEGPGTEAIDEDLAQTGAALQHSDPLLLPADLRVDVDSVPLVDAFAGLGVHELAVVVVHHQTKVSVIWLIKKRLIVSFFFFLLYWHLTIS